VIIGGWREPAWRITDADPGQARQVRAWIRAAITRDGGPVDPDDAALVASELYTNALRHGPAAGRVLTGCWLWPAGTRIVVADGGGPGTPQLGRPEAVAEGGRGRDRGAGRAALRHAARRPAGQPSRVGAARVLRGGGRDRGVLGSAAGGAAAAGIRHDRAGRARSDRAVGPGPARDAAVSPRRRPAAGEADLTVVRADADDLDILSLVIAEAFGDLPPSRWLIPLAAARREIFPGYFRLAVEHALASGVVHTTPGRTAAALWLPGGAGVSGPAEGYDERLAAATEPWTSRFEAFDAALGRRHPAGPHQYLATLAVRPDRQRRGTGTALLRAGHQILDRDPGTAAYLEAASPRARLLYLTFGYADHGPPVELPGGPPMYPMMRPAKARAAHGDLDEGQRRG
jgi:ribosomal protein S18 acetylase RimI-like enzyme/anti-sigma regulatory factor (Ser/Thr protein kinase)